MRSSAGSTKLLKPLSLSLLISIALSALGPRQRAPARCSIGSRPDQVWVPTLRPVMKKVGVPVTLSSSDGAGDYLPIRSALAKSEGRRVGEEWGGRGNSWREHAE